MRRILLTLLAVVVVLGLFAAGVYAGYRLGYAQAAQGAANADSSGPMLRPFHPFDDVHPRGMDNFGRDHDFLRGDRPARFLMGGFGFYWLFRFLVQIAVIGLILWLAYWLFTRSGWRLTRTAQTIETPPPPHVEPEVKEEDRQP